MDSEDIAVLVALMRVEGAGNAVARRALAIAQSLDVQVSELRETDHREILKLGAAHAPDSVVKAIKGVHDEALRRAERHVNRMLHHGVACFTFGEERYPGLLIRYLADTAPAMLWCVGNLDLLDDRSAGIVGTRSPSPAGHAIAADCARVFTREGICVVSGGAEGIDTAAHRAALEGGGTSIIVLPQGMRTYTFPQYVRDALESNRCAIISQFDPEMTWQTHAAVTRNATIAAFSKLVCVVEPKRMGGSMRTAQHAREQGKRVFYYRSEDGAQFAKLFTQSSATPLLRDDQSLDDRALLSGWYAAETSQPTQCDLL
ncbi:MAG: DNA-processing protein DprA [Candidatus Hydrogenedentes bacterium]|nr:DNA-processing protein DprA [Candidatus Hydrogenedentota bacterium]